MVLQTMVTSLLLYQTPNLLVIYGQYNTDNYTVAVLSMAVLSPDCTHLATQGNSLATIEAFC